MKYRIDIANWHPVRLNQLVGAHPMQAHRLKKADRKVVYYAARLHCVPKADGPRRVKLTIVLGPRQRGGDPDAYWKSLLDALVHCGALKNDNRQWVELCPVEYRRGDIPATVIEIEDVLGEEVE